LFAFFRKEKATKKPIVSFDRVYQKISKALGVSYTSVHRIMNAKSNRPKERSKILDDFDHCVIKRTIHGLYSRKISPTISIIHKEIKDSIKISKSKLTLSFDRVYQKTSKALGVSYTSVHRIMNARSNRHKERSKILDDFDHCVIKRTIHGLYSRKIAPTVSIIHKEIKDSIKISKSKLTLTLIDLGYTY
jgi:uncharacterized circularly permuted ATP-grasp superfamily protein